MVLVVKNLPVNTVDIRDIGSTPGSGRSPGGGHGNPLQYSCLEDPMDQGVWWATVHRVTKELHTTEMTVCTHTPPIIAEFTFTVFKIELTVGYKISIDKFK